MTIVLVTGMHRSGTSLLAQTVAAMGIELLGPDNQLPADRHSPHGYAEWTEMREFNDRLLHSLGTNWLAPTTSATELLHDVAKGPLGRYARGLITKSMESDFGVVKDPRFCLTLPFWTEVLDRDLIVLASFRHPAVVARSLDRRDGLPMGYGLRLWQAYNDSLQAAADGLPSLAIWYDDLLDAPDKTSTALAEFLRSCGANVASTREGANAVDSELRRSDSTAATEKPLPDRTATATSILQSSSLQPIPKLDAALALPDDDIAQLARFAGWRMDAERDAHRARQNTEKKTEERVAKARSEALGLASPTDRQSERAVRAMEIERDRLRDQLTSAKRRIDAIEKSRSFQIVQRYWGLADKVKTLPFLR